MDNFTIASDHSNTTNLSVTSESTENNNFVLESDSEKVISTEANPLVSNNLPALAVTTSGLFIGNDLLTFTDKNGNDNTGITVSEDMLSPKTISVTTSEGDSSISEDNARVEVTDPSKKQEKVVVEVPKEMLGNGEELSLDKITTLAQFATFFSNKALNNCEEQSGTLDDFSDNIKIQWEIKEVERDGKKEKVFKLNFYNTIKRNDYKEEPDCTSELSQDDLDKAKPYLEETLTLEDEKLKEGVLGVVFAKGQEFVANHFFNNVAASTNPTECLKAARILKGYSSSINTDNKNFNEYLKKFEGKALKEIAKIAEKKAKKELLRYMNEAKPTTIIAVRAQADKKDSEAINKKDKNSLSNATETAAEIANQGREQEKNNKLEETKILSLQEIRIDAAKQALRAAGYSPEEIESILLNLSDRFTLSSAPYGVTITVVPPHKETEKLNYGVTITVPSHKETE